MKNLEEIKFKGEYIKLQQFIKLTRVVGQGSDVKMLILDNQVEVNGEICLERGRKIKNGDIINIYDFGTFKAIGI